jgi:dipeptidyl aminopeptidase/acylaminoacyl peptidase
LVFVSVDPTFDICIVRTDGSGERNLTNDAHRDVIPCWSPDGRQVAFQSNRSGSYQIWTVRAADGGEPRQVTEGGSGVAFPFWAPDGSRIVYSGNTGLWAVDPRKAPGDQVPVRVADPLLVNSWSSNGDRLAGAIPPVPGRPGIVVCSLSSPKLDRLTDFGAWPVWLKDSRRLIFTGLRTDVQTTNELYILDTESKKYHLIHRLPQGYFTDGLAIAPDNGGIYYPHLTIEADLWLLSLR